MLHSIQLGVAHLSHFATFFDSSLYPSEGFTHISVHLLFYTVYPELHS
jgi:hypothetical protein